MQKLLYVRRSKTCTDFSAEDESSRDKQYVPETNHGKRNTTTANAARGKQSSFPTKLVSGSLCNEWKAQHPIAHLSILSPSPTMPSTISPIRLPAHIWNTTYPRLTLSIPAQAWNAYTYTSRPPTILATKRKHTPKTRAVCKKPKTKRSRSRKARDCTFHPGRGGALDFLAGSLTHVAYKPACMRVTCGNCVRWFGGWRIWV